MKSSKRIWILVAFLLGIQAVAFAIHSGFTGIEIVLPRKSLSSLPLEIGEWTGQDSELDAKVFPFLGTEYTVNRVYHGSQGHSLSLHAAFWPDLQSILPHPPQGCYEAAGWTIQKEKTVEVTTPTAPPIQARMLSIKRENRSMMVLYWYQLGEHIFWNRNDAKIAHRSLWGKEQTSPLMKVMIQIDDRKDKDTETLLREFAGEIYTWTRSLN